MVLDEKGDGMARFDRFDVCAAYFWLAITYSPLRGHRAATMAQLERIAFRPGLLVEQGRLTENAWRIYDALAARTEQGI